MSCHRVLAEKNTVLAANAGADGSRNMNDRHCDKKWYFGSLSRHEADGYLQNTKAGTFLVRDSSTSHGDYVLCVSENSKVSHYIIQSPMHTELNMYVIGDQTFNTLPQVVDFYKVHILDTTTLIEPCLKHPGPDLLNLSGPQNQNSQLPPPPPLPPMSTDGLVCKALYNFTKTDDEDLSFTKGEILTIIKKEEEQWWLARNKNGDEGLVPANYIKPVTEIRNNDGKPGEDGRLSSGAGDEKTSNNDQYRVLNSVTTNTVQYAIVEQSRIPSAYDATQLKLEVGNIIKVLEQNRSGNWKGEINGRQGYFPFNRVRLLDPSDHEKLIEERRKANNASA